MAWKLEGKMKAALMMGYEIGDSIHGRRVIADAGKVSDHMVIVKSARHTKRSG